MNPGHNAANCCSCTFARRASVSIVRLFPRIEIWPRPKCKTLCPVKLFPARWAKNKMRVLAPPTQSSCSSLQLCYILQEDAHEGAVPR